MNSPVPEQSTTLITEMNQLLLEGASKGLWKPTKASCSDVIGMKRRDLGRLLAGERPDSEVIPVLQSMRDVVSGRTIPKSAEENVEGPETEFEKCYQIGLQEKLWQNMGDCAEALELSAETISKYRKTSAKTLSSSSKSGESIYKKTMGKMKMYLHKRKIVPSTRGIQPSMHGGQSSQTKAQASSSLPPSVRQSDATPPTDLASMISHPAIQRIDELEMKLPELIQAALAHAGKLSQSTPETVVPSNWPDEVVAGTMEIKGQQKGDIRFVVTSETFHKLLTRPLSKEEVQDTKKLATISSDVDTELRRRLEGLFQMEESPKRTEAIVALIPVLSERIRQAIALAITIEKIQECDVDNGLIRAMRHFDSLSNIFNS